MRILELIWDDGNLSHIEDAKGIGASEVNQAIFGALIESWRHGNKYLVTGRTEGGRYITVTLDKMGPGVWRPITARRSDPRDQTGTRASFQDGKEEALRMGKIPKFKSSEEAAAYWDKESILDHLDELKPVKLEVKEPLIHTLCIQLAVEDMERLRELGKRRGLGTTTVARTLLRQAMENPDAVLPVDLDRLAQLIADKLAARAGAPVTHATPRSVAEGKSGVYEASGAQPAERPSRRR